MLILVLLLFLAAIGLSPLALDAYAGSTPTWERRSFIGQTYGAASAILAVLALIGIVITLRLQAHETKLVREEARRSAVGELLKMAMEDPDLDECWGPVPAGQDPRVRKQQLYVNMIISEWQMSFETGALGATRLRAIAGEMFQGEVGRTFWAEAREIRLATSENPKARRFHEILDEQYHRVRPPDPPPPAPVRPRRLRFSLLAGLTVGAAIGASALRRTLARRRSRP